METFTAELLRSLKVGDTFNTEGFFQGVSPLPCEWKVASIRDNQYTLVLSYAGIQAGVFLVRVKKDKFFLTEA
jgi:hypothetical protein